MSDYEVRISPDPSGSDREAILAAVEQVLRRERSLARPPQWTVASWVSRRAGVSDLHRALPAGRAWALSARLPWGGREFPGLVGRGDAK